MSIAELNIVDAIGADKKENALRMMISDHLDLEDKNIHLEILQEKINAYLQYLGNKQYESKYGDDFEKVIIEIHFKELPPVECETFLEKVSRQLNQYNIEMISCHS